MARLELFEPNLRTARGSHVIFVHGMFGSNEKTWHNDGKNFSWPNSMARKFTSLNVWGYDYKAELTESILDIAGNFHEYLLRKEGFSDGNIILIGHSFGGLVIKQLIRDMFRYTFHFESYESDLIERIKGVVFLSTPHNGSNHKNYIEYVTNIFPNLKLPSYFIPDDFYLIDLARWYSVISRVINIQNYSLVEKLPISSLEINESLPIEIKRFFRGQSGLIVNPSSAGFEMLRTPVGVDKSHISISKPEDAVNDEVYTFVDGFIRDKI